MKDSKNENGVNGHHGLMVPPAQAYGKGVPLAVIFGDTLTVEIIKDPRRQNLEKSVQKQITDLLYNRAFFVFSEKIFRKVCAELDIVIDELRLEHLNGASPPEYMLQLIQMEKKPHFLKRYLAYLDED